MLSNNEDLRNAYSKLFYQIEVTQYFKEILQENINNRLFQLDRLLKSIFISRKKKKIIKDEKAKLNELIHSLKHYKRKMINLINDISDIERQLDLYKKDTIAQELIINEQILSNDVNLDQVTRPLSEEIVDNIHEMSNINEALKLCDLINFKNKSQYEVCEIYGVHKELFINNLKNIILEDLIRELTSMLSLINKRIIYRRSLYLNALETIEDKVSVNNIDLIVKKLCLHLHILECDITNLKETRISVIKKYSN
ncbi:MAG: hypothetical protein K0Q49_1083 [Haloplasmataceae bacterium]|jgi:hypothetical protein|nr:hypothetical protein [Haloplasmataceae bacterium]